MASRKIWISVLVILLILVTLLFIYTLRIEATGAAVADDYSFTKAICNETNYCQDYQIVCNGAEVVKMSPISGAAVQYPDYWEDPRNNNSISKLCD